MVDQALFDFAVPDELLQEAVAKHGADEAIADLNLMPGTGEGKSPPLLGVLRKCGWAPLVLLTAAAIVPGTFGNGIAIIGMNLEHSFHIHNTALASVAFVAQVSQLLWAVPLAVLADRGSRKVVAASPCSSLPSSDRSWPSLPTCGPSPSSTWPPPSGRGSTTPCTTRTCPTSTRPRAGGASSAGTTSATRCPRPSAS